MIKREINAVDYADRIVKALSSGGILLTTKNGDKVNSMTIGWGTIGRIWNKPYFVALVRTGRFTREQLDKSGEFTVSVPIGDYDKRITAYCGSRTGRDIDKFADLGVTVCEPEAVRAPGIKELPLTIECRVTYSQLMDEAAVPEDVKKVFYPAGVDSSNPRSNGDYHIIYFGEIVKAYVIE